MESPSDDSLVIKTKKSSIKKTDNFHMCSSKITCGGEQINFEKNAVFKCNKFSFQINAAL